MHSERISYCSPRAILAVLIGLFLTQSVVAALKLEGQNKGDTNTWSAGGLLNWQELDYIPCRVRFTTAQGNNQTITLNFEHLNGSTPGVQNLFNFTTSSNIVFTAPPTLTTPPGSSTWSYTFTVNVLDNNNGYVWFSARLAAGAHLNTGSSLALSGNPSSMGNLQIHKPGAAPGIPDLMVVKQGPPSARPGDIISYSLTYSNRATAANIATGVQLSDILPAEVTVVTNTIPANGLVVGNTIYWDLPNLAIGAHGQLTFQVLVNASTPYSSSFTNFSQILNNQDDQNYADNTSTWVTTTVPCAPPSVLVAPGTSTKCSGESITFTSTVNGTAPIAYQWLKDGVTINGATTSSLVLPQISNNDAGVYTLQVSGPCGGAPVSQSATLTVNESVGIVNAPVSLTNCPGTTVAFSVSATGSGLSYQWYRDGSALVTQTNSSLALGPVIGADAGTYAVVVSSSCGNAVTNSATLTVNQDLVISVTPQSVTNCPGTTATFTGGASGTGLNYQWYKDGGVLLGQTNPVLVLNNVSASDAAIYTIIASGICGNAATNSATLTLNENVTVTSPPASLINCPGTTASFSVLASGTGLAYQWFKEGNELSGQTGSSLSLANVTAADAGLYQVVVSSTCGIPVTNSATLTISENLVVATAPTSLTNCPGAPVSFSVSASGTGLSYQWFRGNNLLGTGSTFNIPSVSASDAGTYTVVVSGTCGNAVTNSATLTVNEDLVVSVSPQAATNCPGTTATFTVGASGTSLSYQWYRNGGILLGQTNGTLVLTNVSALDVATYTVVANGICGNAATNSATLTLNENLAVTSPPANLTNCPGTTASFSVLASGTGLVYQWFKGTNELNGETGISLWLTNVTAVDAGLYQVVVSGACGIPMTNSATLTINENILVATAPTSLTNCPGTSASFSVSASGTGLSYQWYRTGAPMAGQTSSTLVLPSVSASDAGSYSVVVSGTCGNAVTNAAALTVNQNVVVASAPQSITNCPGFSATFTVNASGTGLNYQWYRAGAPMAGQTSSTLVLGSVSASDAGSYSVVVSGTCGNALTNIAALTVNQNVVVATAPQSITNCPATPASFSVSASGTGLSYQWFKGNNLLGTGSSFSIPSVSALDAGTYTVVVSGSCGNAITNSATLTVNQDLVVSVIPQAATNCPGTTATFSVGASGTSLSYQWYRNGGILLGQTNGTLVLTNVSALDVATYTVVANGICGNAATNSATLTLNQNVVVTGAPTSLTNCPGSSATFAVNASGTGLNYQWYRAGSPMAGQTSSSLVLPSVIASDAGSYSVVVSGTCGSAITNSAALTVNQNLVVAGAPQSITNCPGSSAAFTVNASGTGLNYQWYRTGSPMAGQTSSTLVLSSVSASDAGSYSVVVSGTCGNAVTNAAALTVNQNVLIAAAPQSITNCPGSSATFTVNASGTGLNYQWYRTGSPMAGQTSSSLVLPSVSASDAGSYSVVVSGTCGNAVTNAAALTVNLNVLVAAAPQSITNCPGSSATFTVNASGTGLNYQWYRTGSPMAGQTSSTLVLPSVSASDAGSYSVVVSGTCGNPVTNAANLTVNQNVVVASAPQSITNCPGSSATFSVNASGTGLNYQWYRAGSAMAGQTSSTLVLASVSASDAGNYSVVVGGACGNAVTNSAALTVNQNVVIAAAPQSITNCPGSSATFTVNASGTGLNHQWYRAGSPMAGQTSSTLVLPSVSASDAGSYSVVVSGTCGNPVTNAANLTVNQNLVIASAPQSITNCPGSSATFTVNASGTGLNYQWYRTGSPMAGQTSSTLVLPSVSASDAGSYSVVVSGSCGSAVTNSAALTVNQNVVIAAAPQSITNCPGSAATFTVNASGTGLNYQWYRAGAPMAGQTSSSLVVPSVSASDAGSYSVVVSGTCGSAVTNSAALTVNQNVVIAAAPQSITNCPSSTATFTVNASGTGLNYQWYRAGAPMAGQTSSSLVLPSVSASDAGSYSVVVSGICGNAVTNIAALTVDQNVVVASAPQSITNCPASSATFTVNASGTGLNYQWYRAGSPMPGRTSSTLVLPSISASDAGSYSVVISGTCGNAVTNIAVLTVNQNVVVATAPQSITNCPGTPASFSVSASGTGLSYQWFRGNNLLGTGSSFSIPSVSASDAGTYTVVVSGTCGNAVTNSATLTVNQDLVVSVSPQAATNCPGTTATFTVGASGTSLSYQWYRNGGILLGQTNGTLVLTNVSALDAATFTVVANGICGNAATNSATLTVNQNVVVSSAPQSIANCPGTSATFTVNASGTGLNYQWYRAGSPMAGRTSSTLVLASVSASDAGNYSVVVGGACGNAVTNSAALTVNQNVVVATAPQSITNCPGSAATFTVNASGTGLNYQWYRASSAMAGQTSSTLVLASVSASDAGNYSVVVSGNCGNAVTNSATLTVNQILVVSVIPQAATNCPGTTATFSVGASGTSLSYQWYRNGGILLGQTNGTLVLTNVSALDVATYSVVANGICGNAATNSATLTVNQNVVVSSAPQSITNCPGASATFTVNASGTGLNYQWYRAGSPMAGRTSSTLVLASVSASDAGNYSVVVSGTCGNPVTNAANLTVNQNVVVASAPQSITNCPGSSATFSVNASGTGLNYQWYRAGSAMAGQTSSTLVLASVSASDAANYSVVVSGTCGNSVTNVAALTVNQNVVIAAAPQSITNCPGSAATFTVNASGTGLNYQWYRAGSAMAGQTSSTLVLASVSASDAANYSVVVSGTCGNSVTNVAALTVNQNVVIAAAPQSITNCPGSAATFTVNASGTGLNYQWYRAGSPLAGQTSSTLVLPSVSASDAANYSIVVSGTCGNSVTNVAALTVNQSIVVAAAPQSVTNCPGSAATFTVNASGTGLNYQWYRAGSPMAGRTSSTLVLASVSASDAGNYSVVVGGACGNAVTNSAALTVNQNVLIAAAPQSITNCPGSAATFMVNASGTGLNYQWYRAGSPLAGQTSSTLTLPGVSASDAANYSVVVSGICGNSVTNVAALTVNQNVVIAAAPQSITNCPGSAATFTVNAFGTGLNYQWYRAGSPLAGQTSSTLTLPGVSASDAANYSVVVSGTCGNSVTNVAALTVNQSIVVAAAPQGITNCPGSAATFTVNASGTGLNYQWYRAGSPMAGQTSSTLVLASVSASDAANYSVVVSGTCGNSVTNVAALTVNQNVVIAAAPQSITNCPGSAATFAVNASGTGLNYQWYRAGSPMAGRTSSTLVLASVSASDAANYSVVVSGTCGNSVTNVAALTVNQSIVVAAAPQSITNCPGSAATFIVNASGTGLNYQWYRAGSPMAGQTSSTLVLPSVSASDAANYSVVVSGICGNAVTNVAALTVNQSIVVAATPQSITNCPGSAATFTVNASGTGLNYQWYRAGSPLAGQTSSTLVLPGVGASDAANYSVVVSGICGNSVTNVAALTVNQNAVIAAAPQSITNCPGSAASFTVNASGTGLNYQWYRAGSPLAGQTSSTLVLPSVSASDAANYSVVVSGPCGNSITNVAALTVNQNIVVAAAPQSVTNCPGSAAIFTVAASGTGLNYQWFKGTSPLASQTSSSLLLPSISSSDSGNYFVVVSGTCGNSTTNSAFLTVTTNTAATALTSTMRSVGDTVVFSTTASGSGPFTYIWKKNGTVLTGATTSSLQLTNLAYADAGVYSVEVGGRCNVATQAATLAINHPPVVTIVTPTNGQVIIAPANFTVLADASDTDGIVTNVDFLSASTNWLGSTAASPYFVVRTNVGNGTYTFTAMAKDDFGAVGVSAPVTVTVISTAPPLTITTNIHLNPQTGLFEQSVRVYNPVGSSLSAIRVYISNLTNGTVVWNASGTNNGLPYVESHAAIAPGTYVDFVIEYYVPSRITPNPVLSAVLVSPADPAIYAAAGAIQHIDRGLMLLDRTFLVEFLTAANRTYYIQYSSDLRQWRSVRPGITGTGTRIQWIDNGEPKTESAPAVTPIRFYRVILVP